MCRVQTISRRCKTISHRRFENVQIGACFAQHLPPRPERTARASVRRLGLGWGGGGLFLLRSGRSSLALWLLLLGLASGSLRLVAIGRGPESEVITKQLHDEGAVAVGLLGQGVELGYSIIEGLLSKVAGTVGRVEDFIVEDGEVQCKTETDRVGRGEVGLGNVGRGLRGGKKKTSVSDNVYRSVVFEGICV